MPSIPVFLSVDTEKTPLLKSRDKPRRTRTVSSPVLGSYTSQDAPPPPRVQRERRVSTSACLTTIHETDENEDFESSTAIIHTPRSGTFSFTYYTMASYHGRGSCSSVVLWGSFILSVILLTTALLAMPVYFQAGMAAGSDAYVAMAAAAIWFPIGYFALLVVSKLSVRSVPFAPRASFGNVLSAGVLLGMSHLGLSISGLPKRTPPVFQAMQLSLAVPVWMAARSVLRKECPNMKRISGMVVALAALAFVMVPEILMATDVINSSDTETDDVSGKWLHPCIFAASSAIFGLYVALVEDMSHGYRADLLTSIAWSHVVALLTLAMVFWVDFLPVVGMLPARKYMLTHVSTGFRCFYGVDSACANLPGKAGLFIGSYLLGSYSFLMLMWVTQGAARFSYMTIALVVTCTTACWILFVESPTFHFNPNINVFTLLILAGVVLFVFAMVLFTMASATKRRPATPINNRLLHFQFPSTVVKSETHEMASTDRAPPKRAGMPRVKSSPALISF